MEKLDRRKAANKTLHLTAIPLRFIAAGELDCYVSDDLISGDDGNGILE